MAEVEVAGLEHAHHLQAYGGFAMEGDRHLRHHALHQAHQGFGVDEQRFFFDECLEVTHDAVYLEQSLLGQLGEMIILFVASGRQTSGTIYQHGQCGE